MRKSIVTRNQSILSALIVALVVSSTHQADAQLRDKLPQESVLLIEYNGTERTREASLTTPFGKMMDDPGMKAFVRGVWDLIAKQIAREAQESGERESVQASMDVLLHFYKYGFALSLGNIAMSPEGPDVCLAVVTPAPERSEEFVTKFELILQEADLPASEPVTIEGQVLKRFSLPTPVPMPAHYAVIDGVFVFTIGNSAPAKVISAIKGGAPTLGANESLVKALDTIGTKNRTLIGAIHVDVDAALAQARAIFKAMGQEDFPPMVRSVLDDFGISGCHSLTMSSQVSEGGYRASMFLATGPDRTGIFKLADQAVLSDDDLSWIPREATMAYASNFDMGKAYDDIMSACTAIPMIGDGLKDAVIEIEKVLGMKLREELLATFKDGCFLFDSPSNGGLFFTGMTLGIEVADSARADALLQRGFTAILNKISADAGDDFKYEFRTSDHGAYKLKSVHFPKLPIPVMPTWCVFKDRLLVGFMPQPLTYTMDRIVAGDAAKTSILANPDYQRGRKLLPSELTSVTYTDTRRGLSDAYRILVIGAMMAGNFGAEFGSDIDASRFPDYPSFTEGLFGDIGGAWVDDEGYHQAGHGPWPFPVPTLAVGGGATSATLVSILLPSLSRARQLAKRTVSMSNLRGVGLGCHVHAAENDGQFPPGFQTLIDSGMITNKMLYAPNSDGSVWSYKYIAGHNSNSHPNWVLAYEDYRGQPEEGASVLFIDGHVEFIKPRSAAMERVEKTRQDMAASKPQ